MAAPSQNQHRCVFVGNIPYDATEEQLIKICEEVGPVVSFRLVTDRETGKPKGYGFCEYKDEETALSARRNLQAYEVNGRQLRVDFAENDKNTTTTTTTTTNNGRPIHTTTVALGDSVAVSAATVMAGVLGTTNHLGLQNDPLTRHLAKMSRNQLTDIMSEFKAMATQDKEQARMLLLSVPSLPKALFQAQIMLGMVTPQMLQMPNIRQASPVQSIQTLHGLPPLIPQNKMQSSLLPNNAQENQVPTLPMSSSQIQRPQLVQNQLPSQPLPSVLPQSLAGLSVRPNIQPSTPSLNQQLLPSLSQQHAGQVRPMNSAYHGPQSASTQSSVLIRPQFSAESYQMQLPSDVDSALLQQVLNLTPEQLNSLPPDQQRQVIQLQQMLRQAT